MIAKIKVFSIIIFSFLMIAAKTYAERVNPVYITNLPNINDYNIFANGGWDGNWYVGYNVCWIERLQVPAGTKKENISRCFIGARVGRAKIKRIEGGPSWEKEPIPGSIYMAISSTSAWKANQRYFLVSTLDIPLEADLENATEGVGESKWFWTEVQVDQVNFEGPNFLAIWSPTDYFVSRDTSPILAGGRSAKGGENNTWLNDEIQGAPPIDSFNSLKTPITVFEPAIAMKLIPSDSSQDLTVNIDSINAGRKNTSEKVIYASISGNNIERAWMEIKKADTEEYQKVGGFLYAPPYFFTLKPKYLPEGKVLLRIVCEDDLGNAGLSQPVEMNVQFTK